MSCVSEVGLKTINDASDRALKELKNVFNAHSRTIINSWTSFKNLKSKLKDRQQPKTDTDIEATALEMTTILDIISSRLSDLEALFNRATPQALFGLARQNHTYLAMSDEDLWKAMYAELDKYRKTLDSLIRMCDPVRNRERVKRYAKKCRKAIKGEAREAREVKARHRRKQIFRETQNPVIEPEQKDSESEVFPSSG
ncbi:hypothetical protein P280DRAFT_540023 [Massarina eburnea CBS 473.64]|uniref:Uncharacterized protein n=1 Tax=Massarina eburnea CBS 473.64 TaxID=1395130 RepID=A0A6A6S7V0_9PLEO|nr:hypothetical protein P280DRAFT_540023 [Massarina eburnea CBS 473.64]